MKLDNDSIRDWLDSINRDRFWLAERIGTTKGTVDQWFSKRGFPSYALKIIERLQQDSGTSEDPDVAQVTFTLGEFELIDKARRAAGYLTRREFYRDAIIEKAREPADATPNILTLPTAPPSARVAEESTNYILPAAEQVAAELAAAAAAKPTTTGTLAG